MQEQSHNLTLQQYRTLSRVDHAFGAATAISGQMVLLTPRVSSCPLSFIDTSISTHYIFFLDDQTKIAKRLNGRYGADFELSEVLDTADAQIFSD